MFEVIFIAGDRISREDLVCHWDSIKYLLFKFSSIKCIFIKDLSYSIEEVFPLATKRDILMRISNIAIKEEHNADTKNLSKVFYRIFI